MVGKLKFILLFLLSVEAFAVEFRLEFTKKKIFRGQAVMANFIISGSEEVLEVEVAKFPEFRGYWSENLVLRQGPIPLAYDFPVGKTRKAIIGTYLIAPMLDDERPEIRPMKVVVKRAGGMEEGEISLTSEGAAPILMPLPPVPKGLVFSGAVGRFSLRPERSRISFRRNEPFQIHLVLTGEGNFRDVNEIPLPKVEGVEIQSQKTSAQGSALFYTKTFEINGTYTGQEIPQLPAFDFTYFDPELGKYQSLTVPEIDFVPAAEEVTDLREPFDVGQPSEVFSVAQVWADSVGSFVLVGISFLLLLPWAFEIFGVRAWLTGLFPERKKDPWKERIREIEILMREKRLDDFLRKLDAFTFDLLAEKMRTRYARIPHTRTELLLQSALPPATNRLVQIVFSAYLERAYSREKPLPENPAGLLITAKTLLKN